MRYRIRKKDLKAGLLIEADVGFTCIGFNEIKEVKADDEGKLYVSCSERRHYLDGQADFEDPDWIVGFRHI